VNPLTVISEALLPNTTASYDEVRTMLTPLTGKIFTNRDNGLKGTLSKRSIEKILSGVAVRKSVNLAVHFHAAVNVIPLFENGLELYAERGSKGEVGFSHKIFALFLHDEKYLAKVTVQEYKGTSENRIYSVEALDTTKPEGILAPTGKSQPDIPLPASLQNNLRQTLSSVNWQKAKKKPEGGAA
jgi:hypothetical protein